MTGETDTWLPRRDLAPDLEYQFPRLLSAILAAMRPREHPTSAEPAAPGQA